MYAITVQENLIFVFAKERNLPTGRAKQSGGQIFIAAQPEVLIQYIFYKSSNLPLRSNLNHRCPGSYQK